MNGGTDRYAGRVDLSFLKAVESQGNQTNSGDDIYCLSPSANPPRQRITARRLGELQERLSERDRAVLTTLKSFRLATVAQLQSFHFYDHATLATGARVTRRTLNRLHDLGAVSRLQRRIGGFRAGSAGHIYTLSPTGHRLLGDTRRKRSHEPKLHHVKHTLAITELAAQLHSVGHERHFDITKLQTEPTCWRTSPTDNERTLKPDLHIGLADQHTELSWFIEIDLATESSTVLTRKLQTYTAYWRTGTEQADHGTFPKVAWIGPNNRRAEFIARTIEDAPDVEPRLFAVTTTDKAIELLVDFTEPDAT